jgi:hypothetical protein
VDAIEHSGEERVRAALCEAGAPFRRPDGSYRLENRLRYVIARRWSPHPAHRVRRRDAWLESQSANCLRLGSSSPETTR